MDSKLQNEILYYAYEIYADNKRKSAFKFADLVEEFNGCNKDILVENLEDLHEKKLIYIEGKLFGDCKNGICSYMYSTPIQITKNGIDSIESPKSGLKKKILKLFKKDK